MGATFIFYRCSVRVVDTHREQPPYGRAWVREGAQRQRQHKVTTPSPPGVGRLTIRIACRERELFELKRAEHTRHLNVQAFLTVQYVRRFRHADAKDVTLNFEHAQAQFLPFVRFEHLQHVLGVSSPQVCGCGTYYVEHVLLRDAVDDFQALTSTDFLDGVEDLQSGVRLLRSSLSSLLSTGGSPSGSRRFAACLNDMEHSTTPRHHEDHEVAVSSTLAGWTLGTRRRADLAMVGYDTSAVAAGCAAAGQAVNQEDGRP